MLKDREDAFGHEIYDHFKGKGGYEMVERDDGFFDFSLGPKLYFMEHREWAKSEKQAMRYAKGKILDIGCGAGRHSLYLQKQGFEVVGIDNSPLAVKVCKARGLRSTRVLSVTRITPKLGVFDTILMLGNNFSLLGNPRKAKWLLQRLHRITSPNGRIIAQTRNPYTTDLPEHLEYHARNKKRGKLAGEARIRIRYKKYVTPWIDFLMVSEVEMASILEGTGWKARHFIDGQDGVYTAVVAKCRN